MTLARGPFWIVPLAAGIVIALLPLFGAGPAVLRVVASIALLSLLVVGMNVMFGYAGELALGYPFIYAMAAYVTGALAVRHFDIPVTLFVGMITAAAVGFLTGLPAVRLGSWSMAMVTLFLVLLIPDVINLFAPFTGGAVGLAGIPLPQAFGAMLDKNQYYTLVIVVAMIFFIVIRNYVNSRQGAALKVMRESPVLARSLGYSVTGLKLSAFLISTLPAAAAGSLLTYQDGYLAAGNFGLHLVTMMLAAAILGGTESLYGAIVGAAILTIGPLRATALQNWSLIIFGVLLVVGGLFFRGGLAGLVSNLFRRFFVREELAPDVMATLTAERAAMTINGVNLRASAIVKKFGGNVALRGVDFEAKAGEITGLIGPNGSGKTTLLNLISGFYRADEGRIILGERDITGLTAHKVARAGVSRTFQTPLIPTSMTVADVVASARFARDRVSSLEVILRLPRAHRARVRDRTEALQLLNFMGLAELADKPASSLPLGTRRILEVARALAGDPALVLLDEPASGLDENEVQALADVISHLRNSGATIVIVEHNFEMVMNIADTVNVLHLGKIIAKGVPSEVRNNPEVVESYLGKAARERMANGGA